MQGFLQARIQVLAIRQPRQEALLRALAEVEPADEATRILGIRAQVARTHVEQVLRARFAVGHAATETIGHADQADVDVRRRMPGEFCGEDAAAEAGSDDGDAHGAVPPCGAEDRDTGWRAPACKAAVMRRRFRANASARRHKRWKYARGSGICRCARTTRPQALVNASPTVRSTPAFASPAATSTSIAVSGGHGARMQRMRSAWANLRCGSPSVCPMTT